MLCIATIEILIPSPLLWLGCLNELYEKLDTCQVKGDVAGAKAVQEQITAIMTGGSTLVFA